MFKTNLPEAPFGTFRIPSNGSWWIVQVQPRLDEHANGLDFSYKLRAKLQFPTSQPTERLDLKNPPTAVGWDSDTSKLIP